MRSSRILYSLFLYILLLWKQYISLILLGFYSSAICFWYQVLFRYIFLLVVIILAGIDWSKMMLQQRFQPRQFMTVRIQYCCDWVWGNMCILDSGYFSYFSHASSWPDKHWSRKARLISRYFPVRSLVHSGGAPCYYVIFIVALRNPKKIIFIVSLSIFDIF